MDFQPGLLFFIPAVYIVFYFPGMLLFGAFFPSGSVSSDTLKHPVSSRVERIFYNLAFGSISAGYIGLFLAGIGQFNIVLLLALIYAGAGCAVIINRSSIKSARLFDPLESLLLLVALVLFIAFLGSPYDWIISGGWDAGNYNNIAANILYQGGALDYKVPHLEFPSIIQPGHWVAAISNIYERGERFIYPRYFHLFPVYIAIFERFCGTLCSQYVNGFFGFQVLVCFYLLLRQMNIGLPVSLFGTVMLAFTGIEYHYFHEVYSELLAQYFFWSGMLALTVGLKDNRRPLIVLAALLFNAVLLTKMDAVLIWQLYIVVAFFLIFLSRLDLAFARNLFLFSVFLPPLFVLDAVYAWFLTRPYVFQVLDKLNKTLGAFLSKDSFLITYTAVMFFGLSVIPALLFFLYRHPQSLVGRAVEKIQHLLSNYRVQRALKLIFASLFGLAILYLFLIRPAGYEKLVAAGNQNAYKLIASIRLFYIYQPILMVLFVFGTLLIVLKRLNRFNCLFIFLPLLSFIYYMFDISHQDLMVIWTYRRLVPLVVPFFAIGITVAVHDWVQLSQQSTGMKRSAYRFAAVAISIPAIAATIYNFIPFWGYTENAGMYDKMREIADRIPDNAPVYMVKDVKTDKSCPTLRFIFHKSCIVIRDKFFLPVIAETVKQRNNAYVSNIPIETIRAIKKDFQVKTVEKWLFQTPWLMGDDKNAEDSSLRWFYSHRLIRTERSHRFELYQVTAKSNHN